MGTIINQINDIPNTIAAAVEEQPATTNEISLNTAEAVKGLAEIAENVGGSPRLLGIRRKERTIPHPQTVVV